MDPLGHSVAAVIDKHFDKECGAAVSAGTAIICAVCGIAAGLIAADCGGYRDI